MTPAITVGLCLSVEKKRKMNLPGCLQDLCQKAGIRIVEIDISRPLEDQGPFDIILHKVLEWYDQDKNKGAMYQERLKNYVDSCPSVRIIDPVETAVNFADRTWTFNLAKDCEFTLNGRRTFVPNYLFLNCKDLDSQKIALKKAGIGFPIICKHQYGACYGREVHDMLLIFDENQLSDLTVPCVVQEFLNHGGKMFKIFTIGERYYVCERPSVKNLEEGPYPTIYFNSSQISKRGRFSPLHSKDMKETHYKNSDEADLLDDAIVRELLKRLHAKVEFHLLGIDIIIHEKTGDYGIVDINYFPGYAGVWSHVPEDFVELFKTVGKSKHKV